MIYAKGAYGRSVEWKLENYLNRYGWVVKKPVRSNTGYKGVLRGGSVNNHTLEVAHRTHQGSLQADNWVYGHGFRCVADVE